MQWDPSPQQPKLMHCVEQHRFVGAPQLGVHFSFIAFCSAFLTWIFPPFHELSFRSPTHIHFPHACIPPDLQLFGSCVPFLLLMSRQLRCIIEPYLRLCSLENSYLGIPGWLSGLAPPSVQGVILETQDRVPRRAPCMEPASPSACVSASLSLSLSVPFMNK